MSRPIKGLVDIIQYIFKLDSYSNSLFLFCGRRVEQIKAVHYEGDGFCLLLSGMRGASVNGLGLARKQNRYPSNSSAGFWRD